MHIYNDDFYEYQYKGSMASAVVIIDILSEYIELSSALDIGCGIGPWLKVYKSLGLSVKGIDGTYVNRKKLLIDESEFISADLKNEVNLESKFSIAQSLEVAEHIPESCADNFVKTLVNHSDCILFSAAVPGQGGEDHINEQPLSYWRKKFEGNGYIPVDLIRPIVNGSEKKNLVEKWYRYNTILYIKKNSSHAKNKKLLPYMVESDCSLHNYSDLAWSLRKFMVRCLPNSISTLIAKSNASRIALTRRMKNKM